MRTSASRPVFDLPGFAAGVTAASRQPDADQPLAGLAGSPLSDRFRHWSGLSGKRYLFSTFRLPARDPMADVPRYADTVVLAVRRREDGSRTILLVADTGPVPDLVFDGQSMREALASGANELHMHLLADRVASRQAIVNDFDA